MGAGHSGRPARPDHGPEFGPPRRRSRSTQPCTTPSTPAPPVRTASRLRATTAEPDLTISSPISVRAMIASMSTRSRTALTSTWSMTDCTSRRPTIALRSALARRASRSSRARRRLMSIPARSASRSTSARTASRSIREINSWTSTRASTDCTSTRSTTAWMSSLPMRASMPTRSTMASMSMRSTIAWMSNSLHDAVDVDGVDHAGSDIAGDLLDDPARLIDQGVQQPMALPSGAAATARVSGHDPMPRIRR